MQTTAEGHPQRIKRNVVKGFRKSHLADLASRHLVAGSEVVSDGLQGFDGVTEAGCRHPVVVSGGGRAAVEKPEFYGVNTVLGNRPCVAAIHSFRPKYAQRCLAEFEYRFHRRYHLPDLIPRLADVALRTPPMPETLLKHGL